MDQVQTFRFVCSREALLKIRGTSCLGLKREIKRRLFYFKLLRSACSLNHVSRMPIPVKITRRRRSTKQAEIPPDRQHSCLRRIPLQSRRQSKCNAVISNPLPSVMLTNARSMKNKLEEISLRLKQVKPDVMVLTESWLGKHECSSMFGMTGYKILRQDRVRHGGGILVYISEMCEFIECTCIDLDLKDFETDIMCFILNPGNVMIIAMYHPYWGNTTANSIVIGALSDIVSHGHITHAVQSLIVCGDFNGLSNEIDELNSLLGTTSLFHFPTRDSAQLDFVLCNRPSLYSESVCMAPLGKSDHVVVFCSPITLPPPPVVKKIQFRYKSRSACANLRADLQNSFELESLCLLTDINELTASLIKLLVGLLDKHMPWKTVRLKSSDKPWVRPSLKYLINMRDKAFSEGKTLKYRRLRSAVILHIKKLKSNFFNAAIKSKNSLWSAIKSLTGSKSSQSDLPDACELQRSFASVYNKEHFPFVENNELPSKPLQIGLDDVISVLRALKNTSPGPDEIPAWFLRENADIVAPLIQHICALSVSSGIFPDALKCGNVIPVPKGKNSREYRPITMLPILSKIMEKIVMKKWIFPLVSQVQTDQFAFLPRMGQGTTVALTFIMNQILSFLDTPGAVRLLMIDYQKAFDSLPHNSIRNALVSMNAPRELLQWVTSFLSNRCQRVKINDDFSDWFEVCSGVPQGGVLSPILFALTIDSLRPKFGHTKIVKYADDVSILHFLRRDEDDHLAVEYNNLVQWSREHGLKINVQKTKLLNFKTKKLICLPQVVDCVSGIVIEEVAFAKLLGLTIGSNFSWKMHIADALRKARQRMFLLHVLQRANAPQWALWKTYCVMIRSILSYAFPAWCNANKGDMRMITNFEKRICRRFNLCCEISFSEFCVTVAKRLASNASKPHHPLNSIFDFESTRYSTRLGYNHRKVKSKTTRFKHSFISFA